LPESSNFDGFLTYQVSFHKVGIISSVVRIHQSWFLDYLMMMYICNVNVQMKYILLATLVEILKHSVNYNLVNACRL